MKLLSVVALAASLIVSGPASAAYALWNVTGGTFSDGGTFTGSFKYDADAYAFADVQFETSGGTLAAESYSTQVGSFTGANENSAYANNFDFFAQHLRVFEIDFDALDNNGGSRMILSTSRELDVFAGVSRSISGGYVVSSGAGGAPEPATWAMMIIGFGAAGTQLRRQRRVVREGLLAA